MKKILIVTDDLHFWIDWIERSFEIERFVKIGDGLEVNTRSAIIYLVSCYRKKQVKASSFHKVIVDKDVSFYEWKELMEMKKNY